MHLFSKSFSKIFFPIYSFSSYRIPYLIDNNKEYDANKKIEKIINNVKVYHNLDYPICKMKDEELVNEIISDIKFINLHYNNFFFSYLIFIQHKLSFYRNIKTSSIINEFLLNKQYNIFDGNMNVNDYVCNKYKITNYLNDFIDYHRRNNKTLPKNYYDKLLTWKQFNKNIINELDFNNNITDYEFDCVLMLLCDEFINNEYDNPIKEMTRSAVYKKLKRKREIRCIFRNEIIKKRLIEYIKNYCCNKIYCKYINKVKLRFKNIDKIIASNIYDKINIIIHMKNVENYDNINNCFDFDIIKIKFLIRCESDRDIIKIL